MGGHWACREGEGALLTKERINPRTNIVQLWILNHPHPQQQHHYPHLAPEGGGKALPRLPHRPQEVLQGKLEVLKMTELSEKNWNHSSNNEIRVETKYLDVAPLSLKKFCHDELLSTSAFTLLLIQFLIALYVSQFLLFLFQKFPV